MSARMSVYERHLDKHKFSNEPPVKITFLKKRDPLSLLYRILFCWRAR